MILADTTIWIDLFRSGARLETMTRLMESQQIVMHPFLVAELALGSLRQRESTLRDLDRLPQLPVMTIAEVRWMIEQRQLFARGIGLIDAQILASCLATPGTKLWTSDRRLAQLAESLGVGAELPE